MSVGMDMSLSDMYGVDSTPDLIGYQAPATTTNQEVSDSPAAAAAAPATGVAAAVHGVNPLVAGAVLVGAIVGWKLLDEWGEPEAEFKRLHITLRSAIGVTMISLAGIPFAKAISDYGAARVRALAPIDAYIQKA